MNVAVYVILQCFLSESSAARKDKYLTFTPFYDDNRSGFQNVRYGNVNFDERLGFRLSRPTLSHVFTPQNSELDETADISDRLDFHYPKVEFLTKINRKYTPNNHYDDGDEFISMNNQKFLTETTTQPSRKNRFKIQKVHKSDIEYEPVKLSYVHKTNSNPEKNITIVNTIKTLDISNEKITNVVRNNTKTNIHNILQKYLSKLYSKKYNKTDDGVATIRPSNYSKLTDDEAEKKLIGGIVTKLKQKAVNKSKLFNLFTIVQFNNSQCNATSSSVSYIGVCYTASECSKIGGTSIGNCASGYGVCCVVFGTCDGSASQNCSYFRSPNYPDYYPPGGGVIVPTTLPPPVTSTGNPSPTPDPRLPWYYLPTNEYGRQNDYSTSCVFSVYKTNSDVNRFRIDFLDLELAGPTNGTCSIERLVITGQNQNDRIPAICGYNTGQHVYVDVSMLSGPLQISVLSTMNLRKRFNIRICQYADTCVEPSSNCLQYFTGVTGTISSLNYDQSAMFNRSVPNYFNNLNYAICIRREAGYCSITYTNVMNGVEYPFQFLNLDSDGTSTIPRGQAGVGVMDCPDDYILLDGVRLCGDKFNDGTTTNNASLNAAVTDTNAGPIVIPVRTDSSVTGVGFKLFYTQNRCTTTS